ncbi:MAG: Smr/MutS family protein [Bacteroidota bacterium]
MTAEDLWIGDRVQLKVSGREGIYKGTAEDGRHRVTVGDKVILTSIENLHVLPDIEPVKRISIVDASSKPRGLPPKTSVDLHAEMIDTSLQTAPPQMILRRQLQVCQDYLDDVIAHGMKIVTIIHGKGDGTLRTEVRALLEEYPQIHFYNDAHDGGATEVWLR